MGANTKIEWTHHTFNPWRGCTKVSPGCAHCYADAMSGRNPAVLGVWGPNGTRVIAADAYWRQPIRWNREASAAGERRRVFCASLADVFEGADTMPADAWDAVTAARRRLGQLILDTPHLDWLLLTKRPGNVLDLAGDMWIRWHRSYPLPDNVWLGTSVEDQTRADERIPALLAAPARVRFLSMEPLLGPVSLNGDPCPLCHGGPSAITGWSKLHGCEMTAECGGCDGAGRVGNRWLASGDLDWIIVGGESGHGARPMQPEWPRSIRDQCNAAGVSFFFKQWGEWLHTHPSELHLSHGRLVEHEGRMLQLVGKKDAGRVLDGRTWDEVPS